MKKRVLFSAVLGLTFLTGCYSTGIRGSNNISVKDGVDGKDGKNGVDGKDGKNGVDGKDGKNGVDGKDGKNGENGVNGIDGSSLLTGTGSPKTTEGKDGDSYVDISTWDYYKKANGQWMKTGNIKGDDGHTPTLTIGENGNWLIDGVDTNKKATIDSTEYFVCFDVDGGTLPSGYEPVIKVTKGECVLDLPSPTKQDYIFEGWYVNDGANQDLFTATTPVNANISIKAKWKPVSGQVFTITWLNYDGTLLSKSKNVLYNTLPTYQGETPTKPSDEDFDYTFSSWSPSVKVALSDAIYVAQYSKTRLKYNVTFDMQGKGIIYGSGVTNGVFKGEYNSVISAKDFRITYNRAAGDNFISGWYTDELLTKQVSFPYVVTKAVTLYPKWTSNANCFTYSYDSENEGYILRQYLNGNSTSMKTICVPSTYDDGVNGSHPVITMRDTFKDIKTIETAILPDSMTSIGDNAFCNSSVQYVTLPQNIVKIPDYCFKDSSLREIQLNDEITEIGKYAFENTMISVLTLPKELVTIKDNAFCHCEKISYVKFNDKLEELGECAFNSCYRLIKVDTNQGLKSIGGYCFEYSKKLESILIPKTVTFLSGYVPFRGCDSLSIYFEFESYPFDYMNLGNGPSVYYLSETDPGTKEGSYWHYVDGVPTKW